MFIEQLLKKISHCQVLWLILIVGLICTGVEMRFSTDLLANCFSNDAGAIESFAPEVIESVSLLRDHNVKRYNNLFGHSEHTAGYGLFAQLDVKSSVALSAPTHPEVQGCKLLEQRTLVGLYDCTQTND